MKELKYPMLYLYFDNKYTDLSDQYERKIARILRSTENNITGDDLYEVFELKIRLQELRRVERDLTGLCIEVPKKEP